MLGPDNERFRKRLLGRLHSAGVKRGLAHEDLRDVICPAFGVHSLSQLSVRQLRECIQKVGQISEPDGHARTRPHARGSANASMKVASHAQLRFIRGLQADLNWTAVQLDAAIAKEFDGEGLAGMSDIRTSADASRVIRWLKYSPRVRLVTAG